MPFVLCYTKPGLGTYPDHNYPGHVALNCDWEHAVHLAISEDGKTFKSLRNNTGVLFARAAFDEGDPRGVTKTLTDPWLCRDKDGRFLLCAIRRNQNAPDSRNIGSIMLFTSRDLVRYEEAGFLPVAEREVRHPQITWTGAAYRVRWQREGRGYCALSDDLASIGEASPCEEPSQAPGDYGIEGCVAGNVIEISDEEANILRTYLDVIEQNGVKPIRMEGTVGQRPDALPKAICTYTDGSCHEKPVDWDVSRVDWSRPGTYRVPGTIRGHRWPFPIPLSFEGFHADEINDPNMETGISDPCVTQYRGKYYLSSSGNHNIVLRCADTIEGVFSAKPQIIYRVPMEPGVTSMGTWAAELHEIDGVLYLFTALCPNEWIYVKSVVLRLQGEDPMAENAWEAPVYCRKPDGSLLTSGGISLDMTYFRDGGRDYVMWSDRVIRYGTSPLVVEPANIFIATVDPAKPWQCTSEPVCLLQPMFGWDRYETEVDEAPYLLRHGDELFITISGSSTGMADLYDVGVMRARTGADLLNPSSWDWIPYPLLTKESVPGQYGPGHNNFLKDPQTGDDLMVFHAVPHDSNGRSLNRRAAMRRVHWAKSGLPYLEMTPERDLKPEFEKVEMELVLR